MLPDIWCDAGVRASADSAAGDLRQCRRGVADPNVVARSILRSAGISFLQQTPYPAIRGNPADPRNTTTPVSPHKLVLQLPSGSGLVGSYEDPSARVPRISTIARAFSIHLS